MVEKSVEVTWTHPWILACGNEARWFSIVEERFGHLLKALMYW